MGSVASVSRVAVVASNAEAGRERGRAGGPISDRPNAAVPGTSSGRPLFG